MYVIHFPGPFGGYFNKDRNGQPYMSVGAADRATHYETMEGTQSEPGLRVERPAMARFITLEKKLKDLLD